MFALMKNIVCGHCIKGFKGEPIKISRLEKFVNLWARENNVKYVYDIEKIKNVKVAIVGSGPAGIECRYRTCKKRI